MKQLIALVLTLVFILSLSGCSDAKNNQSSTDTTAPSTAQTNDSTVEQTDHTAKEQDNAVPVNDSLILVQSIKPYVNFLWSESWSEDGWISADAMRISSKLSEIHHELPQITYADDFEIHYKEGVTLLSLSVYNSDFEEIHSDPEQEILSGLTAGVYYLVITVKEQGQYIQSEESFEYTGYECAYKIVVAA